MPLSTERISDLLEQPVTYHGSITEQHGRGVVDEVCGTGKAEDPCDQLIRIGEHEDLRWVLRMANGAELSHVRRGSFTLVAEASCPCGASDAAHCAECWRCPGNPHDDGCSS